MVVSPETIMLVLVIVTALAFDFTNGFHDTGNAMAASISTGALKPKAAVGLSAILNLVGAFLSVEVALTVTNAVIKIQKSDGSPIESLTADGGKALLLIVLAGLVGGILWNLLTWLLGLPSSSSHALLGGLTGAGIAGLGWAGVKWTGAAGTPEKPFKLDGIIGKILMPSLLSPIIACLIAMTACWLVYRIAGRLGHKWRDSKFKWGQVGAASLVSLAHGTNDAQKTMGVMTLALIASGHWSDTHAVPFWVKFSAASAIALGTYLGGWRIIRTLGKGIVDITPPQGMAGDAASATVILASSHLGFALSTTHVATGSVIGAGVGRGTKVRWNMIVRMLAAWAITFPAAGAVAWLTWQLGNVLGSLLGSIVIFIILCAFSLWMYLHSQKNKIDHTNVTHEWDDPHEALEQHAPDESLDVEPLTHASHADPAAPSATGSVTTKEH